MWLSSWGKQCTVHRLVAFWSNNKLLIGLNDLKGSQCGTCLRWKVVTNTKYDSHYNRCVLCCVNQVIDLKDNCSFSPIDVFVSKLVDENDSSLECFNSCLKKSNFIEKRRKPVFWVIGVKCYTVYLFILNMQNQHPWVSENKSVLRKWRFFFFMGQSSDSWKIRIHGILKCSQCSKTSFEWSILGFKLMLEQIHIFNFLCARIM